MVALPFALCVALEMSPNVSSFSILVCKRAHAACPQSAVRPQEIKL